MTARRYTIEQYRRDVASLPPAPGLRATLDAAVTADAELAPPVSAVMPARRRATTIGVAPPAVVDDRWAATAAVLRELAAPSEPVTPAVLRAADLRPRPSGRAR